MIVLLILCISVENLLFFFFGLICITDFDWRGSHTAFNCTWWVDCLTHLCIVLSFGMFLTYLLLVLGQSFFYMYLLFYHSLTEHLLMRWSLWSCKSREFLFYTKMDEILANINTIKVKKSFQLMKHGPILKKYFL